MSAELLTSLLRDVSRSFYLTMRILPAPVRSQISLAYLLARTSDTIADTELIPLECRVQALQQLHDRIMGPGPRLDFTQLSQNQASTAERILLERCEEALSLLAQCSEPDQRLIRDVLDIIISGQTLDLERFAYAGVGRVVALQTDEELADYTYRVAGCVGEFWTRICRAHLFPDAPLDENLLLKNGVRFGQGLQLVNILRDLPRDLRNGRCYIPTARLQNLGLSPLDLLSPEKEPQFRPLYNEYLAVAEAHLRAGWLYTNTLPRNQVRVRLACAWPILIGMKTLRLLRQSNVLDPAQRIKVTRRDIRSLIFKSVALYPLRGAWERQIG